MIAKELTTEMIYLIKAVYAQDSFFILSLDNHFTIFSSTFVCLFFQVNFSSRFAILRYFIRNGEPLCMHAKSISFLLIYIASSLFHYAFSYCRFKSRSCPNLVSLFFQTCMYIFVSFATS